MSGKTLFDKLWKSHLVRENEDGTSLLYIDRQLIHEVTSPQAFDGMRLKNRSLWRTEANVAVPDHNIPTKDRDKGIQDPISKLQVDTLDKNCDSFQIKEFKMSDPNQGIVHVIGPEQGLTLPGMTIVCGDSHTSTHGALGALAFGIGTSEVEHVLATQCLIQQKSKNMLIKVDGKLKQGITAKDLILFIIGKIGTAGGTGYAIEFGGNAIKALSMEGRMTVCNMTIEAGARAGLIAVDQTTLDYVHGKPFSPEGELWKQARNYWKTLQSDEDAAFDKTIEINANDINPMVTWGTSPELVVDVEGKKIADSIKLAMVVPGSGPVKDQAEKEGLDKIFLNAGFEWREPGCYMCLAMNADRLESGERCASTSNRNLKVAKGKAGGHIW